MRSKTAVLPDTESHSAQMSSSHQQRASVSAVHGVVVGLGGLEPPASSLSEMDGQPLCYLAFPLVVRLRKSYKDGVNLSSGTALVLATYSVLADLMGCSSAKDPWLRRGRRRPVRHRGPGGGSMWLEPSGCSRDVKVPLERRWFLGGIRADSAKEPAQAQPLSGSSWWVRAPSQGTRRWSGCWSGWSASRCRRR